MCIRDRSKLVNVSQTAIARFDEPKQSWANTDDCGEWTCTGLWNTLIYDLDGSLTGQNGTLIPENKKAISSICEDLQNSNGYFCKGTSYGILMFESLDSDRLKRLITPINITAQNSLYSNDLNTYMDHTCLLYTSPSPRDS
eukprot:TRINITY_DN9084_c0_g1_i2.p1 TRINITY_DN9084_c0_g1~~TRINITY_DN9084_c0_g1_i2.p1  ORF type:complete len:141 (+),score=25.70 TRINITY_DN9084_c0_g1_i2:63-485(+)